MINSGLYVDITCVSIDRDVRDRKRKSVEVDNAADTVSVGVYAFDLLALGGNCLTDRPFSERRSLLYEQFKTAEGFSFGGSMYIPLSRSLTESVCAQLRSWTLAQGSKRRLQESS